MKKLLLIAAASLLLFSALSCESTAEAKAEVEPDLQIEATLPTEYGDLTLVLYPKPEVHGDLEFVFGK